MRLLEVWSSAHGRLRLPHGPRRTTGSKRWAVCHVAWLWALEQQTDRIKSLTPGLRPSLLPNPRLCCYYKH
jgi:hypothetical protein